MSLKGETICELNYPDGMCIGKGCLNLLTEHGSNRVETRYPSRDNPEYVLIRVEYFCDNCYTARMAVCGMVQ